MSQQLSAALAAEQAAIFAYGAIGAALRGEAAAEARGAEALHRDRRDALIVRLAELQATPTPAQPAYTLPFPVVDPASALRLALHVEQACAATWRAAVPATEAADRQTSLDALTASSVLATRWRRLAGVKPLTVPFPGLT